MDYSILERQRCLQAIDFARETRERSRRIVEDARVLIRCLRGPFAYPRLKKLKDESPQPTPSLAHS